MKMFCDATIDMGAPLTWWDLVHRRIQSNKGAHKLSSTWKGPYIIHEVLRSRAYHLEVQKEGYNILNEWKVKHLCRFYA